MKKNNNPWYLKKAYIAGPIKGLNGTRKTDVEKFYQDISLVCAINHIDAFVPINSDTNDAKLNQLLKRYNHNRYHPLVAQHITKRDKVAIRKADVVIMFATDISSGAGIEQEFARVCEVPLILIYQNGQAASPVVVGNNNRPIAIINFTTFADGIEKLDKVLTKCWKKF